MSGIPTSYREITFSRISRVNALIATSGGVLGLVGWMYGISLFYQFGPDIPAMFPWTAACVTAVGIALIGRNLPIGAANKIMTGLGAACVTMIMLVVLFEYATGSDSGFDRLLFTQQVENASTNYAGRPSPQSAVAFAALGLALLGGLLEKRSRGFNRVMEGLTLLSGCVALVVFFGYAYSVDALFSVPHLNAIGMSPYTAAYLLLACVAALIAEPSSWTVKILTRTSSGGDLARILLPIFIFVPLVLGLLRIEGERAGWISHEMGTSLMALAQVLIGVSMLFWVVHTIDRAASLEKIVTMSCVSKKVLRDGEWITIEEYLHDQYHVQISHGMTPQEAETWLNEAKDSLAREKARTTIVS
jgi:two-component system cell cycle sensor histidine kinase/response regulator CckA